MPGWFVRPQTSRLDLSDGQWLIVKQRLTAGEQRAAFARMYLAGADGRLRVHPLESGLAQITAYLLDWSLTDDDGKPVAIRDLSAEDLTTVLDNLDPDRFTEIKLAVERHEEAQLAARAEKKKAIPAGETEPGKTSPSPSDVDGLSMTFAD